MEENIINKNKSTRFSNIIIILVIILSIIFFSLIALLWSYLEKYEQSTPQAYIKQVLSYIDNGDNSDLMKYLGVKETEFFTAGDYKKYLKQILPSDLEKVTITEMGTDETGKKQLYKLSSQQKSNDENEIILALTKHQDKSTYYTAEHINLKYHDFTINAPSHINVLVDGKKLSEKHKINKNSIEGFTTINNKNLTPQINSYKITGLIKTPEITLQNIDKNEYNISLKNNVANITTIPNAKLKQQIEQTAKLASKAYANFVSHDGEFKEFTQYVLTNTSYYKTVCNFDNQWYVSHNKALFENAVASNTIAFSDNCFSCEVSFDYVIVKNKIRRVYETKYKIYFVKDGQSIKIVNLELL